jgi:predicted small metal-binding protein
MNDTLRTRCVCGWETTGSEDEVVAATLDHGLRVHNMPGTREQVLERAERVAPAAPEAPDQ